jgi:hypothetical protein
VAQRLTGLNTIAGGNRDHWEVTFANGASQGIIVFGPEILNDFSATGSQLVVQNPGVILRWVNVGMYDQPSLTYTVDIVNTDPGPTQYFLTMNVL